MLVNQKLFISAGFKHELIRINRWNRYKCCRKKAWVWFTFGQSL